MYKLMFSLVLCLTFFHAQAQTFTLKSSDLGGQSTKKQEFNGFGCTGENVSPQLSWENAPAGTKSFAITMYDPDAPTGSGWWHWLAFDIAPNVSELKSGAGTASGELMPKGSIQSLTNYGQVGYGGPCPPEGHGYHTYIITVYALSVETLGLDAKTNPAIVGYYLNSNVIQKASIVSYFKRP
ncbi:MAG: YbhB/YbcL family Raf kinase inhibitor-like protein [Bacteroidota bacterium]